jgi:hypothetical protein
MFGCAMDKPQGLYVGVYSGSDVIDADYERCLASMQELDGAGTGLQQGILAVLVTDPECPRVPPAWRKRMAEFNDAVKARIYCLALVTTSPLIRGVLTAINWLSPPKAGHQLVAHATFELARRWGETVRGAPLPRLTELLAEARRRSR